MKAKARRLIEQLSQAHAAPGFERSIRDILRSELGKETRQNKFGCLHYEDKRKKATPTIMITAHMDEVGFIVQSINEQGFIKFLPLGGWSAQTLLSQRVRILTRDGREIIGVIGMTPVHLLHNKDSNSSEKKMIEDLYIDIGARDERDVKENFGIRLGNPIVPESRFTPLYDSDLLLGKAFDNRVGVALLIQTAQQLKKEEHPNRLCFAGTTQEELGIRGARTAASSINPDLAIILETAPADDTPGLRKTSSQGKLGAGPTDPSHGSYGTHESSTG